MEFKPKVHYSFSSLYIYLTAFRPSALVRQQTRSLRCLERRSKHFSAICFSRERARSKRVASVCIRSPYCFWLPALLRSSLWQAVTNAINAKDMEAATEAKTAVEETQRELRRKREDSGEQHIPRFFEHRDGHWVPKLMWVSPTSFCKHRL